MAALPRGLPVPSSVAMMCLGDEGEQENDQSWAGADGDIVRSNSEPQDVGHERSSDSSPTSESPGTPRTAPRKGRSSKRSPISDDSPISSLAPSLEASPKRRGSRVSRKAFTLRAKSKERGITASLYHTLRPSAGDTTAPIITPVCAGQPTRSKSKERSSAASKIAKRQGGGGVNRMRTTTTTVEAVATMRRRSKSMNSRSKLKLPPLASPDGTDSGSAAVEGVPTTPGVAESISSTSLESSESISGEVNPSAAESGFSLKEALLIVSLNEQRLFAEESMASNAATAVLLKSNHRLEKETENIKESLRQLEGLEQMLQQSLARTRDSIKDIIDAKNSEDLTDVLNRVHHEAMSSLGQHLDVGPAASKIQMAKDGRNVRGGTLHDLVAFLTHQSFYSSQFTSAFLLTYKSFTTPEALFHHLLQRWNITDAQLEAELEASVVATSTSSSAATSSSSNDQLASLNSERDASLKLSLLPDEQPTKPISIPSHSTRSTFNSEERPPESPPTESYLWKRPGLVATPRKDGFLSRSRSTSSSMSGALLPQPEPADQPDLVSSSSPRPPASPSISPRRSVDSADGDSPSQPEFIGGGAEIVASQEREEHKKLLRRQIRLRVIAVLKLWLRDNWSDFERCSTIIYLFVHWLQTPDRDESLMSYEKALESLRQTFMKKLTGKESGKVRNLDPFKFPPPILPKELAKGAPISELLDPFSIDHVELARQISIAEQKIFQAIESRELLNQNWNRANKIVAAPNVSALVNRVNATAGWVMNSIVCCVNPKVRVKRLDKWIRIAQACRELGNLNAVLEILSGLGVSSVYRLRKTWDLIDTKLQATYEELKAIMSPNQNAGAYRACLRSLSLPCVPYIGFVLTDITFSDDGMPNYLDEERTVINFQKRQQIASLIEGILHYKQVPYSLHEISSIQSLMQEVWLDTSKHHSQEVLHAISKVIEP